MLPHCSFFFSYRCHCFLGRYEHSVHECVSHEKINLRNLPHLCPIYKSSYEERSLGVFESPPDDKDAEPDDIPKLPSRRERVGRYLGWHLRRQMSIGMSFVFPLQKFPFRLRIFIYLFYYHYVQIFGGSYGLCSSLPSLNGRTFWMNP